MKVSLTVKLTGRKAIFTGTVTPPHRGRVVVIQKLVGTKWVAIGKAKLSAKSMFRFAGTLTRGTYDFRAVNSATVTMGRGRAERAASSSLRKLDLPELCLNA